MSNTVAIPASTPEPQGPRSSRAPAEAIRTDSNATQVAKEDLPDLRLVIEEDQATGTFIYKTLDRRTGEVVQQFPREQVLQLQAQPGYQPGSVVNTRG